ncbi:DUF937 domain-containing protein [Hutsoniella sourekii]|uniref:DUF937 domain-containing protein n=1 Tax=Hutsoniella sourekii TaxID=87650 RepID=UPI0004ADC69E|nr:DUF937 domain-containing protein [Hutsoniella sourekii]
MALFDQIGSLVDMFTQANQTQQDSQVLANRAGVDIKDLSKIAALGLPAILQGLNRNNQSQEGLDAFNQALNQHEQDIDRYSSSNDLANQVDEQDGDKILGHVFNDKQSIIDRIADTLGIEPAAVKRVLILLAPIVLKYLADQKRQGQLDADGVQKQTERLARETSQQVEQDSSILEQIFGSNQAND